MTHRWMAAVAALCLVPAASAQAGTVAPGDVIAAISHDWNDDGLEDRAVLVDGEDEIDLYLALTDPGSFERRVVATARDIAWRGEMAGTRPELALAENGSLLVRSMNESIGRTRWVETLTIAFRDGQFFVAGYTRLERDTVVPEIHFACDVNLLSGKGVFNDRTFRSSVRARVVDRWRTDVAQICPAE